MGIFVIVVAHNPLLLLVTALDLDSMCVHMLGPLGHYYSYGRVSWDRQPRCPALYTKKSLSLSLFLSQVCLF